MSPERESTLVQVKRRQFRAPTHPRLFDALGSQRIGRTFCFLCGRRLSKGNRSDEHVFPRWLQRRYDLWDKQLTLLNGTTITYRNLTIPCCRTCNSRHLAPIERIVKRAVEKGPSAVRRLSKRTLFLWLSKILYGILFKEGLLRGDRRRPRAGRLVSRRYLKAIQIHHQFLQGSRIPIKFIDCFPASIFVYRLQRPPSGAYEFNFRDLPVALCVALQMGTVGIVAALHDARTQERAYGSLLRQYERFALHPVQFLELIAAIFYRTTLLNRIPKYIVIESVDALNVFQLPLRGFSLRPIYDDWENAAYAQHLSFHTGLPMEQVFRPPMVATYVHGPDRKPQFLDLRTNPWYPE
jgi:hypothetical protein